MTSRSCFFITSQLILAQTQTAFYNEITSNIVITFEPSLQIFPLSFIMPHIHSTCSSHFVLFDQMTQILSGEEL
jgi:hypothetical protein